MSHHFPVTFVAGDTWQLNAMLLDPTGAPIDLTGATIKWTMLNAQSQSPLGSTDFQVATGPAPGEATITITPDVSTTVPGGHYTDWWRVILADGVTQTLLFGGLDVIADPFALAARAAAGKPNDAVRLRVVA